MVAAFWAGIPVEVTQETDVVPRRIRAAIGTPFYSAHTIRRKTVNVFYPLVIGDFIPTYINIYF